MEDVISTPLKKLGGKVKKVTASSVEKISQVKDSSSQLLENIKEYDYSDSAQRVGNKILKVRRKTIAFYKRPLRDITHLSIVLVMIITLFTGFINSFAATSEVKINPFIQTENNVYLSNVEKRMLEADSVSTIAYYYSEPLAQDASKLTEELYTKANVVSGETKYLSSVPILTPSTADNSRNKVIDYTVADGDTLSGIATKFGITTDTVRYANKIEDIDSLKPGTKLIILPVTGVLHTVSAGETLAGIAFRYKSTEALIESQNNLYGEALEPGMKLLIPDGEIPEAPKPKVETPAPSSGSSSSRSSGTYGSNSPTVRTGNFGFPTLVGSMGYYNGYHNWAIDIPNNVGTPVFASDGGRIVEAQYGWNGGYGTTILIDHGNGTQTRYAHLSSINVVGGYVSKGQVIGLMGNTGRSTGPHLHFEIIVGGVRMNPLNYL